MDIQGAGYKGAKLIAEFLSTVLIILLYGSNFSSVGLPTFCNLSQCVFNIYIMAR